MLRMISPARSPFGGDPPALAHLSSRAGSRLSQRRLAPAFETIDISGWLISCTSREVSCPTVVARETRARSACATRIASSAARWLVMSVMMP